MEIIDYQHFGKFNYLVWGYQIYIFENLFTSYDENNNDIRFYYNKDNTIIETNIVEDLSTEDNINTIITDIGTFLTTNIIT